MKTFAVSEFCEIISDPTTLGQNMVVQHADLPEVDGEVSVTLRLKLKSHGSNWAQIFRKGFTESEERMSRTPALWLSANNSKLHARFTSNWTTNAGIEEAGDGLLLSKWYHLTYTLSDIEKRLDCYIDSEWVEYYSIQKVQTQRVVFNDAPLYIGGFDGEISNFRYFNWRLSAHEVMKDYSSQRPFKFNRNVRII